MSGCFTLTISVEIRTVPRIHAGRPEEFGAPTRVDSCFRGASFPRIGTGSMGIWLTFEALIVGHSRRGRCTSSKDKPHNPLPQLCVCRKTLNLLNTPSLRLPFVASDQWVRSPEGNIHFRTVCTSPRTPGKKKTGYPLAWVPV